MVETASASLTQATVPAGPRPKRRRNRRLTPYLWILPGCGLAAFVVGYPIVANIGASFTDPTADGSQWVGLAHYRQILGDPHLYESLWLTAVWTIGVTVMQFLLGFL